MFANSTAPDSRLAQYDHLIVHVTATPPNQDLDDRDIDKMHRNRGFSSCGYNALIKRDGTWLDSDGGAVTRPIGRTGAHVGNCGPGWNRRSFGVSMVGGVDSQLRPDDNMTAAQKSTLARGIQRFLQLHPNGATGVEIMGHRDLIRKTNATQKKACPCFDVIPWWASVSGSGIEDADEDAVSKGSSAVDMPEVWVVQPGDTLSKIQTVSGLSIGEILSLNPQISNINLINVGDRIRLA